MNMTLWHTFGFLGQSLFFCRFVIQWIVSERKKESVIPIAFWYFSLIGSMIVLIYSIRIRNPVFIVGQTAGFAVYLRNLFLIYRKRNPKTV